jgi:ketosteroid isomerase-like protein
MNRPTTPCVASHPGAPSDRRTLMQAAAAVVAAALVPPAAIAAPARDAPDAPDARGASAPAEVARAFAWAFNARDLDALMALYLAGSVFVPAPGQALRSPEAVRQALQSFLAIGLPIEMAVRHVYEAGDTALLVVDWAIRGTGANGQAVDLAGTGTDVVMRGAGGRWYYRIDNPFGALKPAA